MTVAFDLEVDAIGKLCPTPILMLAKAMREMEPGQVLKLLADDAGAVKDVPSWCKTSGNEFLSSEEKADHWVFYVRKK